MSKVSGNHVLHSSDSYHSSLDGRLTLVKQTCKLTRWRHPTPLALLTVYIALAGCGDRNAHPPGPPHLGSQARQLKRGDLTPAERKYGIAPRPDPSITYQPDVIMVGGGAEAIRSQSASGFIWTIDASAARADELAPGKVFFMTGRAVGRVLDVRKDGKDLIVTTGPVDIAELIRECDIQITRMPLDFGEAIPYTTPDLPAREVTIAQLSSQSTAMPALFMRTAGTQPVPPAPDVTNLIDFQVTPVVSSSGLGMRIATDAGGLKVSAEALAHLAQPTLDVRLKITLTGGVEEASVTLTGAAGLTWKFDVGTDVGLKANVNKLLTPDTDFSIPVYGIGGLPFAVTVRQRFEIKTALGVRNSTLSATGDYVFHGGFMVEYAHGKWDANAPAGFSAKQSVMQSMNGISIAASGLEVGHQLRVIVGVGQSGFAAGPYFSFSSSVGVFKGSDLGMVACKEATLVIKLNGGVGYVIPKSVTNAINSILSALNIKYSIKGEGGISPSTPLTVVNSTSTLQGCKAGKA